MVEEFISISIPLRMADAPMDVDDEVEAPSSSTSKGDKKRFEVKKVRNLIEAMMIVRTVLC